MKLLGFWWARGVLSTVWKDLEHVFMEKFTAKVDFLFSLFKHQNAQAIILLPCLRLSYDWLINNALKLKFIPVPDSAPALE